jgi:hypothetical protein
MDLPGILTTAGGCFSSESFRDSEQPASESVGMSQFAGFSGQNHEDSLGHVLGQLMIANGPTGNG